MDTARIAALLTPFTANSLSEEQLGNISIYIDMLIRWNQKLNLTAIRDPEQIVTRHFGESLFAAEHLVPASTHVGADTAARPPERSSASPSDFAKGASNAPKVIDVGSGAGFPGVPIKIRFPELELVLIESNHKKATFLREVIRSLRLSDAEVFAGRAEDYPTPSADIVTLRAVERFTSALPVAAHLVAPGGRLGLLIGQSQVAEVAPLTPEFAWAAPVAIPLSTGRVLLSGTRRG